MSTVAAPHVPPVAPSGRAVRLRRAAGTAAIALGAGTLGAVVAPQPATGASRDAAAPAHALSVTLHSEEERAAPAAAIACRAGEPATAGQRRMRRARTLALHWWSW